MKSIFIQLVAFWLLSCGSTIAQDSEERSNLMKYTPSLLLAKGQTEIKVFNNLYTQTAFYNSRGEKQDLGERSTFFTSINQVLVGMTPKINVGVMVFLRAVSLANPSSSPFSVLQFKNGPNARTTVNFAGPTVRFAPFSQNKHISFQSTFLMTTAKDQEGVNNDSPFLDFDKHYWWTQVYYDKLLPNNFVLFLEADLVVRIDKSEPLKQSFVYNPLKVFFGRFMGSNWGIYVMTEWAPFWGDKELLAAYYMQTGGGIKYQVLKNLELEAVYTVFPTGKNSGAGKTFNFGLRFLR
ncbi:MAG: hypothetical protein JKX73_02045 [Flavobacteriales bacterium]|nr:hypothetical protein [Flavobacteriales bacterium]